MQGWLPLNEYKKWISRVWIFYHIFISTVISKNLLSNNNFSLILIFYALDVAHEKNFQFLAKRDYESFHSLIYVWLCG